jgi:hypothetical protein
VYGARLRELGEIGALGRACNAWKPKRHGNQKKPGKSRVYHQQLSREKAPPKSVCPFEQSLSTGLTPLPPLATLGL